jgi:hypothetical protein
LLGFLGAFFSLIYGALLLTVLGIRTAARLMLQREAELLVSTRPPQAI